MVGSTMSRVALRAASINNENVYLPMVIMSSLAREAFLTGLLFSSVPLVLPRSSIM